MNIRKEEERNLFFTKLAKFAGFLFLLLFWNLAQAQNNRYVRLLINEDSTVKPLTSGVLVSPDDESEFPALLNDEGLARLRLNTTYHLFHPRYVLEPFAVTPGQDTLDFYVRLREIESVTQNDFADSLYQKLVDFRKFRAGKYRKLSTESFRFSQTYIDKVPREIPYVSGRFFPGQADTGVIYLSQVASEFYTVGANLSTERVMKRSEAGIISKLGWRESADFLINPYERFLFFSEISKRGYLSPFDEDYESNYVVHFDGVSRKSGRSLYVYSIKPKRNYSPFFTGEVWVDSASTGLVFIDLKISSDQQIEIVDTLSIQQFYNLDNDPYKRPLATFFTFHFDILGSAGEYQTVQVYQNFRFLDDKLPYTPIALEDFTGALPTKEFTKPFILNHRQQMVLQDDELYRERWERGDIADSLLQYYTDRPFQALFIKGMNLPFYQNKHYVRIYPLWYGTGYNTVEGFYTRLVQESNFDFDDQSLRNTLEFRLGFSDNRLKFRNLIEWKYDYFTPSKATLDFGNYVFQFNEANPILPVINSVYSIFLGRNYIRLYNKAYGKLGWEREFINGLTYNVSLEYARRNALANIDNPINFSGASWSPFARVEFDRNNDVGTRDPRIITRDAGFIGHNAMTIDMDITYQLFQRYKMINGRKINLPSNYPKFYAQYKKGLPVLGAITDFDFLAVGMGSTSRLGNAGTTRFDVSGGGFINRNNVQFVDFKHFNGLQTIFLQRVQDRFSDIKQFRTMRYYNNSTDRYFVEAHFEHNFGGYLLSKLPLINRTKIHLVAGFNYLSSEFDNHFLELFFGFDNIYKVGKVEFAGGWDDFRVFRLTMRLGVNFDHNFYRDNKRR
jgi:hypothetical protein